MNPNIPNIAVIASSIVVLLGLIGVDVLPEDVQRIVEAILVVLITAGGIWSWIKVKFLSDRLAVAEGTLAAIESAEVLKGFTAKGVRRTKIKDKVSVAKARVKRGKKVKKSRRVRF